MTGLITVEEHRDAVLARTPVLPAATVALDDAHGRTLARGVVAAVDIPVFDNSAMDGFAVRYADVRDAAPSAPAVLRVVADLPAGTAADPALGPGEAARIMTGSPVPSDADAIVPFEDTAGGLADSLETVTVRHAPSGPGAHVRRAGGDSRRGDEVLAAGVRLGAHQIAAAAAAGVPELVVGATPRVAVVSTGDELAEPGTPLARGRIPESNSRLLAGLVADADAALVRRATVPDDPGVLAALLAELTGDGPDRVDAVVLSGGVSAGAYEVVKQTLADDMTFHRVAMQPGKPQGFGCTPQGTLLFGLPGNPVSVAVSFEVFVRPALLRMQGRAALDRPVLALPAAVGWRTPPQRRQYLPVILDRTDPRGWTIRPATSGGSHLAGGLGRAEAWAVVPADVDAVAPGDVVDVMLMP